MNEAMTLTFAAAVPFLALALLLWLARLEETLTDGLETPMQKLEPAPVIANAPADVAPARAAA